MTVCIAALCKDREGRDVSAVVVVSDRMVTLGSLVEFEHEIPKIDFVQERIAVLMAGEALKGSRLARDLRKSLGTDPKPIDHAANILGQLYSALRDQQIETDIFRPRGLQRFAFYAGQYTGIGQNAQMFFTIDTQVHSFNLGVDLLIAGVDESGGHIYSVGNPGGAFTDFHQIGYHAIGSGALHALQTMIGLQQSGLRTLEETVFAMYASKRRAEAAPGVGKDTDIFIIEQGAVTKFDEEKLRVLSEVFEKFQRPAMQEIKTEVSKLI
jgi:20S proteasome alpha/beta subunit